MNIPQNHYFLRVITAPSEGHNVVNTDTVISGVPQLLSIQRTLASNLSNPNNQSYNTNPRQFQQQIPLPFSLMQPTIIKSQLNGPHPTMQLTNFGSLAAVSGTNVSVSIPTPHVQSMPVQNIMPNQPSILLSISQKLMDNMQREVGHDNNKPQSVSHHPLHLLNTTTQSSNNNNNNNTTLNIRSSGIPTSGVSLFNRKILTTTPQTFTTSSINQQLSSSLYQHHQQQQQQQNHHSISTCGSVSCSVGGSIYAANSRPINYSHQQSNQQQQQQQHHYASTSTSSQQSDNLSIENYNINQLSQIKPININNGIKRPAQSKLHHISFDEDNKPTLMDNVPVNPKKWKTTICERYEKDVTGHTIITKGSPRPHSGSHTNPSPTGTNNTSQCKSNLNKDDVCKPPKKRRKIATDATVKSSIPNESLSGVVRRSSYFPNLCSNPLPNPVDLFELNRLESWPHLDSVSTGTPCLQYTSCCEYKIKSKCLSCRSRKTEDENNKFYCRFVGFQLICHDGKSVKPCGFADWQVASEESNRLYSPAYPVDSGLSRPHAQYMLPFLFKSLCAIMKTEMEYIRAYVKQNQQHNNLPLAEKNNVENGDNNSISLCAFLTNEAMVLLAKCLDEQDSANRILWRRAVEKARETCDVCETTIFNMNWTCIACGYNVCPECYRDRRLLNSDKNSNPMSTVVVKTENLDEENTEEMKPARQKRQRYLSGIYSWAYCTNNRLEHSLHFSQLFPGLTLWQMSQWMHKIAHDHFTTATELCSCTSNWSSLHPSKQSSLPTTSATASSSLSSSNGDSNALHILASVLLGSSSSSSQPKSSNESNCSPNEATSTETIPTEISSDSSSPPHNYVELVVPSLSSSKQSSSSSSSSTSSSSSSSSSSLSKENIKQKIIPSYFTTKILWLTTPSHDGNVKLFQKEWNAYHPVIVSNCHHLLNTKLWKPRELCCGASEIAIIDCIRNTEADCNSFSKFWDGFESVRKRPKNAYWKVKDWPTKDDFAEEKPEFNSNLYESLPLPEYTQRNGAYNLAARLPQFFAQPDLGPKFYMAYGMAAFADIGTTNLHLDIADAVNLLIDVRCPKFVTSEELEAVNSAIYNDPFLNEDSDFMQRMNSNNPPGALWHIFAPEDTDKLRSFLIRCHPYFNKTKRNYHKKDKMNRKDSNNVNELNTTAAATVLDDKTIVENVTVEEEMNCSSSGQAMTTTPSTTTTTSTATSSLGDPVHDQLLYVGPQLLRRLYEEEGILAYSIVQFKGDAVFIPAGSAHQVRNLHSCIKAAVDFVSPEHVEQCLKLTEEFRNLSRSNANHADKLQVKNMLYHTVKDCCAVLQSEGDV